MGYLLLTEARYDSPLELSIWLKWAIFFLTHNDGIIYEFTGMFRKAWICKLESKTRIHKDRNMNLSSLEQVASSNPRQGLFIEIVLSGYLCLLMQDAV